MKHTLLITERNVLAMLRTERNIVLGAQVTEITEELKSGKTVHWHGLKLKPRGRRFRTFHV